MLIIKQDQNRRWTFVNHQFEFTTYGWLDSHLYITLTSTTLFMDKQRPSVDTSEFAVEPERFKLNEEGSCWKGIVKYFARFMSLEHTIRNPQNATSLQQALRTWTTPTHPQTFHLCGTYQGPWWSWWSWPDSTAREKAPWCGRVSSSNPKQN